MQIKVGQTRFVLVFSTLVLKLPRIRLVWMIGRAIKYGSKGEFTERVNLYAPSLKALIIRYLTHGVVANWREYQFSRKYRHQLIVPTIFSFFGLINLQPRGEAVSEESVEWASFAQQVKERGIRDNDFQPLNFSLVGQRVKMHDYASLVSQQMLLAHFA